MAKRSLFIGNDGINGPALWITDGTQGGTYMLKDLRPGLDDPFIQNLVRFGEKVLFTANDGSGYKLWVTDGTTGGTVSIADGVFQPVGEVGEKLLLLSNDSSGWKIWVTDGTIGGTSNVGALPPGSGINGAFAQFGDRVLIQVTDYSTNGLEPWISDGTPEGTHLLKDILPGSASSNATGFTVVGDKIVFRANDGSSGNELWVSDGTEAGTVLLKDIHATANSNPHSFTPFNGKLLFTAISATEGEELWITDGTTAGTQILKDIRTGTASGGPGGFAVLGSKVLFQANDGTNGYELWSSDGTSAGTVLLKDINAGAGSGSPFNFVQLGNKLVFQATTAAGGRELWVTDGTSTGTVLLKDIYAGGNSSSPDDFKVIGDKLIFEANDGVNGYELWVTDGTPGGTMLLRDMYPGPGSILETYVYGDAGGGAVFNDQGHLWFSDGRTGGTVIIEPDTGRNFGSSISNIVAFADKLLFTPALFSTGDALWTSDGTSSGTVLLKDLSSVPGESSFFRDFAAFGVKFLFYANTPANGFEPWVTDGTAAGTFMLKDINAGTASSYAGGGQFQSIALGNKLIFTAFNGSGTEPWVTDGTAAGTVMLKDIVAGAGSSSAGGFTAFNGQVYFNAGNTSGGSDLWRTDGTAAGTVLLKAFGTGFVRSQFEIYNNKLFFSASDSVGEELWVSDGTAAGTVRLIDIYPGTTTSGFQNSSRPDIMGEAGGKLIFTAETAANGRELWVSDGTAAGTTLLKDIVAGTGSFSAGNSVEFGGRLYFLGDDGISGNELWVTDGTAAGTFLFKDINTSGHSDSNPQGFSILGDKLLFRAITPETGEEMWVTDGTASGTVMLADIFAGTQGSGSSVVATLGNLAFIYAQSDQYGVELWVTDGTAGGTRLLKDIAPGQVSSLNQSEFQVFDGKLYFTADDGYKGSELWVTDGTEAGTTRVADIETTPWGLNPNSIFSAAFDEAPVVTITPPLAPVGPEARVNTFTADAQTEPAIATLSGGGYVITWKSNLQDGAGTGIYAQRYDAAGIALGGEVRINTTTTSAQFENAIGALSGGGYVIAWTSSSQDQGSTFGVYAQRYDASGTPLGGEVRINSTTAGDQRAPSVAALSDGGYVITWSSSSQDGSGFGVYAQRYNASGTAVGAETRVNTFTPGDQTQASVAGLPAGGYVVTWISANQDGNSWGIYAQRYDSSGVAQGGEFRVNSFTAGDQRFPSVAALSGGGFVVTWTSNPQDGDQYGIYAQRYDAFGVAVGAEVRINVTTVGSQLFSSAAALSDGGYAITWTSIDQNGNSDVHARRYDAAGNALGGETQVNSFTAGAQGGADVVALPGGEFLVAWVSDAQDGSGQGVYAQRFGNGSVSSFAAVEQLSLSLKGSIAVADADASPGTVTVTVSVDYGILNLTAGTSGATIVSGNGTGSVVISGTLAQINALLSSDGTSTVTFTANTDAPPASTTLTVTAEESGVTGSASVAINIAVVDDPAIATADSASVAENGTVSIAVLANDSDPDGPQPALATINGVAVAVGASVALASGATVTRNADGTLTYDPNHAFDTLTSMSTGQTGATNTQATDSFAYALGGGASATVTVTVNGVASPEDRLRGDAGANVITGTDASDYFDLSQGGDDNAAGGDGNDGFFFGAAFTAADRVDGGAGSNDQIGLQGDYTGLNALTLGQDTIAEVEAIVVLAGFSYEITTVDENVAAGGVLSVQATLLAAGQSLRFNGSAETDGSFMVYGGNGDDNLTGGAGNDGFYFGPGGFTSADIVNGGGGTNDQLGLDGDYTITLGGNLADIEAVVLLHGAHGAINHFNITAAESLVAANRTMTIFGLQVETSITFNGAGETDGDLRIYGGTAGDALTGGGGADWIFGGNGGDTLTGGAGNDIFFYDNVLHSNSANRDEIQDFNLGDLIDLSGIDAISGGTNDAFIFIGNGAFTNSAGQLRFENVAGATWLVQGDTDGNGVSDFELIVVVADAHPLTSGDFTL